MSLWQLLALPCIPLQVLIVEDALAGPSAGVDGSELHVVDPNHLCYIEFTSEQPGLNAAPPRVACCLQASLAHVTYLPLLLRIAGKPALRLRPHCRRLHWTPQGCDGQA